MTKIIVQHFVENLLKVLKVLKTRTALKRMFSWHHENIKPSSACAPHGKALKRFSNQKTIDKQQKNNIIRIKKER